MFIKNYGTGGSGGISGTINTKITNAYDSVNDMIKVESMQKKFRDSFSGSSLDLEKWNLVQTGSGHTVTVSGGQLSIATGVNANSETIIESKDYYTVPFKVMFGVSISQKIANQEFYIELVSVNDTTYAIDELYGCNWKFDNTCTTTSKAKYSCWNGLVSPLLSSEVTVGAWTTASIKEIEIFSDEVWWHDRVIDSTSGRSASYVRHQMIPDPTRLYKIRIRAKNLGTAPASSTTMSFPFIVCNDYAELTAEITSGRGNSVAGQGIYATVGGTVAISGTPTVSVSGTPTMVGAAAHDAAISGNPVRVAGRAVTSNYAAVATGDVADLVTTLVGAIINKPYSIPEQDFYFACTTPIVNTTDLVVKTAAGAGLRNYVTSFQYHNTNAVATEVVLKDGAVVIWRGYAPASMTQPVLVSLLTPLKGTANTALNFACITTAANVYIDVQGYSAP